MRKLLPLFITAFLLFTSNIIAQEFTLKYKYCLKTDTNGVKSEWKDLNSTFVFYKDDKDEVLMTVNGETEVLKQIGDVAKNKTVSGSKYEIIDIEDSVGVKMRLQIFEDEKYGVRLLFDNGETYQFAN